MSATHATPALPAVDAASAAAALRQRGLRVSAARRLVLEALYSAGRPIPADAIAAGLDGRLPRSDLASVYRNLDTLEELGLVSHMHAGHGAGLYAPASSAELEYLVCERCGSLQGIAPARLDGIRAALRESFGFEASFKHFPIAGLCSACTQNQGEE